MCFQPCTIHFASNLLQLNSFQPFTIQLFLTFYNPAASNCYKILSKFWKTENVPNSNLLQPSFFQSFTTQLLLTFYNPLASNLYDPGVSNLYNPDVYKLFQPGCFQPFIIQLFLTFYNPAKGMDQNPTKALSGSHFEFEKLYSWTIHNSNVLGWKYSGNAMNVGKIGSKTIIFTIFGLFLSKIEVKWPKTVKKRVFDRSLPSAVPFLLGFMSKIFGEWIVHE